MDKAQDTIDWLDLDDWLEKDTNKQQDMHNAFAWLAQDCQPGEQQLQQLQQQHNSLPEPLHSHSGLLFPESFQQHPAPLLPELPGVS